MKKYILFIPVLLLAITSCKPSKEMLYFSEMAKDGNITQVIPDSIKEYESPIKPDDMLLITVTALDPNAVAIFNLPTQNYLAPGESLLITTPSMQTYLVDSEGCIDYPVLGKVKIGGMTRKEATEQLKEKISKYVENPIVNLQCINHKVTVLGEVTRPGTYEIKSERTTILDALGLANDITIYGNHTNVLLIREENGTRTFNRIDLSQPDVFTSPYYYLQRNDVIYVEPNDARKGYAKYSQNKQYTVSIVSAITSAVSVVASLFIALYPQLPKK